MGALEDFLIPKLSTSSVAMPAPQMKFEVPMYELKTGERINAYELGNRKLALADRLSNIESQRNALDQEQANLTRHTSGMNFLPEVARTGIETLANIGAGVAESGLQTVHGAGTLAHVTGLIDDATYETMSKMYGRESAWAQTIQSYVPDINRQISVDPETGEAVTAKDISSLGMFDPRNIARQVSPLMVDIGLASIPGLGIAKGMALGGRAISHGSKAARISNAISSTIGGMVGAVKESDPQFMESLEINKANGMTPEGAMTKAVHDYGLSFVGSFGLNAIGIGMMTRYLPDNFTGWAMNRIMNAGVEGLTESIEEGMQRGIIARDVGVAINNMVNPEAALMGFIGGGLFSANPTSYTTPEGRRRAHVASMLKTAEIGDSMYLMDDGIQYQATKVGRRKYEVEAVDVPPNLGDQLSTKEMDRMLWDAKFITLTDGTTLKVEPGSALVAEDSVFLSTTPYAQFDAQGQSVNVRKHQILAIETVDGVETVADEWDAYNEKAQALAEKLGKTFVDSPAQKHARKMKHLMEQVDRVLYNPDIEESIPGENDLDWSEVADMPQYDGPQTIEFGEVVREKAPPKKFAAEVVPEDGLTSDAEALLSSIEEGQGMPTIVTNNLKAVARKNGIKVEGSTTPDQIITELRKKALGAEAGKVEAKNVTTLMNLANRLQATGDSKLAKRIVKKFGLQADPADIESVLAEANVKAQELSKSRNVQVLRQRDTDARMTDFLGGNFETWVNEKGGTEIQVTDRNGNVVLDTKLYAELKADVKFGKLRIDTARLATESVFDRETFSDVMGQVKDGELSAEEAVIAHYAELGYIAEGWEVGLDGIHNVEITPPEGFSSSLVGMSIEHDINHLKNSVATEELIENALSTVESPAGKIDEQFQAEFLNAGPRRAKIEEQIINVAETLDWSTDDITAKEAGEALNRMNFAVASAIAQARGVSVESLYEENIDEIVLANELPRALEERGISVNGILWQKGIPFIQSPKNIQDYFDSKVREGIFNLQKAVANYDESKGTEVTVSKKGALTGSPIAVQMDKHLRTITKSKSSVGAYIRQVLENSLSGQTFDYKTLHQLIIKELAVPEAIIHTATANPSRISSFVQEEARKKIIEHVNRTINNFKRLHKDQLIADILQRQAEMPDATLSMEKVLTSEIVQVTPNSPLLSEANLRGDAPVPALEVLEFYLESPHFDKESEDLDFDTYKMHAVRRIQTLRSLYQFFTETSLDSVTSDKVYRETIEELHQATLKPLGFENKVREELEKNYVKAAVPFSKTYHVFPQSVHGNTINAGDIIMTTGSTAIKLQDLHAHTKDIAKKGIGWIRYSHDGNTFVIDEVQSDTDAGYYKLEGLKNELEMLGKQVESYLANPSDTNYISGDNVINRLRAFEQQFKDIIPRRYNNETDVVDYTFDLETVVDLRTIEITLSFAVSSVNHNNILDQELHERYINDGLEKIDKGLKNLKELLSEYEDTGVKVLTENQLRPLLHKAIQKAAKLGMSEIAIVTENTIKSRVGNRTKFKTIEENYGKKNPKLLKKILSFYSDEYSKLDYTRVTLNNVTSEYGGMTIERQFYSLPLAPAKESAIRMHDIMVDEKEAVFYQKMQDSTLGAYIPDAKLIAFFQGSSLHTGLHEFGHVWRYALRGEDLANARKWAHERAGIALSPGEGWSEEAEEYFANAFMKYALEGRVTNPTMKPVFEKLRNFLLTLDGHMKATPIEYSDEMHDFFAKLTKASVNKLPPAEKARVLRQKSKATGGMYRNADEIMERLRMDRMLKAYIEKFLQTDLPEVEGKKITHEELLERADQTMAEDPEYIKHLGERFHEAGGLDAVSALDIAILARNVEHDLSSIVNDFANARTSKERIRAMKAYQDSYDDLILPTNNALSEAGRALNAAKLHWKNFRMAQMLAQVDPLLTPIEKHHKELAEKRAREMGKQMPEKYFNELMKTLEKGHFQDNTASVLWELLYSFMLSNPVTHQVNLTSTLMWSMLWTPVHIATRGLVDASVYRVAMSSPLGKAVTKWYYDGDVPTRKAFVSELLPHFAGYRKAKQATKASTDIFFKGFSGEVVLEHMEYDLQKIKLKVGERLKLQSELEAGELNATGDALRKSMFVATSPLRALEAADAYFSVIAYDSVLNREYFKEAMKKTDGNVAKAKKLMENIAQDPVKYLGAERAQEIKNNGIDGARYAVFMDAPGAFTRALAQLRSSGGIPGHGARLLIPFVNTLMNLFKRGTEMTPIVGLVTEWSHRNQKLGDGKKPSEFGHTNADVIAKQIQGTMIIGAVLMYLLGSDDDEIKITGAAPQDANARREFYGAGKKPWAIKYGDSWISYRTLEPFNIPLMLTGAIAQGIQDGSMDDRKIEHYLAAAGDAMGILLNQGLFRNFESFASTELDKKEKLLKNITQIMVPYNGAFRWAARMINMQENDGNYVPHDVKDFVGAVIQPAQDTVEYAFAKVAGKEFQLNGIAKRDGFGEEIVYAKRDVFTFWLPVYVFPDDSDSVDKELADLGYYPSLPEKTRMFNKREVELDDEVYADFVLKSGKDAKDKIRRFMETPGYARLGKETRVQKIKDIISDTRSTTARKAIAKQLKKDALSPKTQAKGIV